MKTSGFWVKLFYHVTCKILEKDGRCIDSCTENGHVAFEGCCLMCNKKRTCRSICAVANRVLEEVGERR